MFPFKTLARRSGAISSVLALALAGCGGGGSSGETGAAETPVAAPANGVYAWVLKAQGATAALRYGLSLIHPSDPATEWVVEEPGNSVTDAVVIATGTANPGGVSVQNLQPSVLVYIHGGDVRRVSLRANGQSPRSQVLRAGSSSACRFLVRGIDHVDADRSRFVVATAGADGVCSTSDDGAAEVQLSAGLPGITVRTLTGLQPTAVLRDPATLAPRAWVGPVATTPWTAGETPVTYRTTATQLTRVLLANHRAVLAESLNGLSLIDFAGGGTFSDTRLAAAGVDEWQPIGYDDTHFYVWRNSGGTNGSWQILRVTAGVSLPTPLATGTGQIGAASLGRDQIYVTVFGSSGNQLIRVAKRVTGAPVQVVETAPAGSTLAALTSSADVHLVGSRSAAGAYNLRVVDEAGGTLYSSSNAGGFPLLLADDSTLRLNFSENTNRFVFVDRFGARGFADNQLLAFDVNARRLASLGTLPGQTDFGTNYVFANANAPGGGSSFMGGFSAASVGGVVQTQGTRTWSFDAATDNSLRLSSRRQ